MTPLFFKGSEGALMKPFVPTSTRASQKSSDLITKPSINLGTEKTHLNDESKMSRVDFSQAKDSEEFAFMK